MSVAELIEKQAEIIEQLVKINAETLTLLSQYTEVTDYEQQLDDISGMYAATRM